MISKAAPGYRNVRINGFFNRYGLRYGIYRGLFLMNPLLPTLSYVRRKEYYYRHISKRIWRKYGTLTPTVMNTPIATNDRNALKNVVWVAWHDGFYDAPEIVKLCRESLDRHIKERTIVELNAWSLKDYVVLPSQIYDALDEGRIPIAVYYDIVRYSLLGLYGGTWIDATVLLTGDISSIIKEKDFFATRRPSLEKFNAAEYASWFLHAEHPSDLFMRAAQMLCSYWHAERNLCEYLLPYIVLTTIVNHSSDNEVLRRQCLLSTEAERLLPALSEAYDSPLLKDITSRSHFHKLSYKLPQSTLNDSANIYAHLDEI